jgi:EmrB/QacA subfamily drug resistance transporter
VSATPDPRRWQALGLICTAVFMTVLDIAIVNVALPSIGEKLHFSADSLQWVITAYAITFGGFLLLGGRAADLLGRRRIFMVGLAIFTGASLACGLANSETFLIVARGVQGFGAAVVSPAALSIIAATFEEGAERNKALGIWGAVAGSGAAVGVLAGGVLTTYLGWEWIFFVNVPIGAVCLLLTPLLVHESRVETAEPHYDAAGALTITSSLILLVFAVSKAPDVGWSSARTIGLLVGSAVLFLAFLAIESRARQPLVPFSIFRVRVLTGANVVGFLLGGAIFGSFFLLTQYMQLILGYSALKAGVAFLATAGTSVVAAGIAQALVTRVGVMKILATGMALTAVGLSLYTRFPVDANYWTDVFPGFVISGVGIAFAFVPVSIAALSGVTNDQAGLASGLINTSQQIGGAIGTAIVSSVAISALSFQKHLTPSQAQQVVHEYSRGFWVGFGFAVAAVAATLLLIREKDVAVPAGEADQPARAAA